MSILTLGQYLRPSAQHLPVARYYHPDEFAELAEIGKALGFTHVESGPLVRSSYHAKKQADAAQGQGARSVAGNDAVGTVAGNDAVRAVAGNDAVRTVTEAEPRLSITGHPRSYANSTLR